MRRRTLLKGAAGGLLLLATGVHLAFGDVAAVFTSGTAKMLCSAIFAGDRDPELARQQDVDDRLSTPGRYLGLARTSVDLEAELVTASLFGWQGRTAVHREGLGCTAAEGASVEEILAQSSGVPVSLPEPDPTVPWPEGGATLADALPDGIDADVLDDAMDAVFAEPDPARPKRTRAVVVVHEGRIIAERYADGFDRDDGHLSNSVAKSLAATLVGMLVHQGRLDIDEPAPIDEWRDPDDRRSEITLNDLLQMSSGLEFEESYAKIRSDITMQYVGGDLAGYSVNKQLEADPGEHWSYSTGTANILGRIIREAAPGDTLAEQLAFPRRALFDPMGMRTAVLEADVQGNFVTGSSFYASARDYARLGLLHLRDGVWTGQRLLPEGWVEYVSTPVPDVDPARPYGAQFWLNWDGQSDEPRHPEIPRDAIFMNGHQGQHVWVVPSLDLVVVRTGLSEFGTWNMADLVADVIDALPT